MKTYQIFWNDLTDEARERLGEMYHENMDDFPIATIEIEEEEQ